MKDDAGAIWQALDRWARLWGLTTPRISPGWVNLPPSLAPLARGGWIDRPMLEPPAATAVAEALERETGLALPDDLRGLHALHDGTFAPLLPFGACILSYEAMLSTWRSLSTLADEYFEAEDELVAEGTHLSCAYHRAWLPIASSDSVEVLLDFAPGPNGNVGQVLMQSTECDYVVVGGSTTELLRHWLELLDEGSVRFDPAYGHALAGPGTTELQLLCERHSRARA